MDVDNSGEDVDNADFGNVLNDITSKLNNSKLARFQLKEPIYNIEILDCTICIYLIELMAKNYEEDELICEINTYINYYLSQEDSYFLPYHVSALSNIGIMVNASTKFISLQCSDQSTKDIIVETLLN